MKEIPNRWIGRRNKKTGYLEVVSYEGALRDKPKGWKVIGYTSCMTRQQAKMTLSQLV